MVIVTPGSNTPTRLQLPQGEQVVLPTHPWSSSGNYLALIGSNFNRSKVWHQGLTAST